MEKFFPINSEILIDDCKPSVAIYWDFENVRVPHQAGLLINFAQSRGNVVTKKVYSHWWRETKISEYALNLYGFEQIDVLEEFKNSTDRKLESDCLAELLSNSSPDIIILISGDKGFVSLIRKLKLHRKQVVVIGRRDVTNYRLIALADEFYFAEELFRLVG